MKVEVVKIEKKNKSSQLVTEKATWVELIASILTTFGRKYIYLRGFWSSIYIELAYFYTYQ